MDTAIIRETSHKNCFFESFPASHLYRRTRTWVWQISLFVLLSQREGSGIMSPNSSPEHVPTGVPSPSVNSKEWSVLGFYHGAPTHGRHNQTWVCVQFHNDWLCGTFYALFDNSQWQREQDSGKTENECSEVSYCTETQVVMGTFTYKNINKTLLQPQYAVY